MDLAAQHALSADQQFWLLLANLVGILVLKITLVVVSYLVIKMGYQLLVDGVKGEFKFKSEMSGVKADLASASPGTLFVFLGVVVMIFALVVTYEPSVEVKTGGEQGNQSNEDSQAAPLPTDNPFN